MATRIYLPGSGSAAVSPAMMAAWDLAPPARRKCSPVKAGTSMVADGFLDEGSAADYKGGIMQFVSGPLPAQTITGTVKGQVRAHEESSLDNFDRVVLGIRVVSNDGTTFRGTLLSLGMYVTANEFPNAAATAQNRKIADGDSLSSVTAQANDRLVIELGVTTAGSTGFDGSESLTFGDNSGTDLPEDETTTAANNPWIEFSQDLNMGFTEVCTSVSGAGFVTQPGIRVGPDSVMGGGGFVSGIGAKTSLLSIIGDGFALELAPPFARPAYDPNAAVNVSVNDSGPPPVMVVRPTTPSSIGDQTRFTGLESALIEGPGSGDFNLYGTAFTAVSGSGGIAGVKLYALLSVNEVLPGGETYVPCTLPSFLIKIPGVARATGYGFVSGNVPQTIVQQTAVVSDLITTKPGGGAWTWADVAALEEMGVTAHYTLGLAGTFACLRMDEAWMEVYVVQGASVEPVRFTGKCGNLRRMLQVTGDVEG